MEHDNLAGRHGHKRPQLPGPDVVALSRTFFGEDAQSRLRRRCGAYNHDAWFFGTAPCILRWTIGFEMRAFGEVEPGAARLGAPRRARCVVHLELITPISQETKDLLEKHVKATGIKKGHLIESASVTTFVRVTSCRPTCSFQPGLSEDMDPIRLDFTEGDFAVSGTDPELLPLPSEPWHWSFFFDRSFKLKFLGRMNPLTV